MIGLFRMMLARHVADSTAMERLLQESGIDWTIARPPYLKDGGAQRGYRAEAGVAPTGAWSMQRGDLAAFLLDEVESHGHPRMVVGLASA